MEFSICKKIEKREPSERVAQVLKDFDMTMEHAHENFSGNIDIEEKDWNVGLIVGASGTGKSTIAKEVFGDSYVRGYEYYSDSVLDDMPKGVCGEGVNILDVAKSFAVIQKPELIKELSK